MVKKRVLSTLAILFVLGCTILQAQEAPQPRDNEVTLNQVLKAHEAFVQARDAQAEGWVAKQHAYNAAHNAYTSRKPAPQDQLEAVALAIQDKDAAIARLRAERNNLAPRVGEVKMPKGMTFAQAFAEYDAAQGALTKAHDALKAADTTTRAHTVAAIAYAEAYQKFIFWQKIQGALNPGVNPEDRPRVRGVNRAAK